MKLSTTQKRLMSRFVYISRMFMQWGYIPLILYLGKSFGLGLIINYCTYLNSFIV